VRQDVKKCGMTKGPVDTKATGVDSTGRLSPSAAFPATVLSEVGAVIIGAVILRNDRVAGARTFYPQRPFTLCRFLPSLALSPSAALLPSPAFLATAAFSHQLGLPDARSSCCSAFLLLSLPDARQRSWLRRSASRRSASRRSASRRSHRGSGASRPPGGRRSGPSSE
jgi:hypothetical protein